MGFPQAQDWRRQPPEVREALLSFLQKENVRQCAGKHLSPLEMAKACGIDPDPWQRDVLISDDPQTILNCTRQGGKSTVTALKALPKALYREGSLTLVLAPSMRQSSETFRKIIGFYNELEDVPAISQVSSLKLELANRSRIIVLPGKEATIRGFSDVSLLIVDEASRVPDELYQTIRPMLAVSQGQIILLSTPFGSRGFFWREWAEGGDDWKRILVPASECPRIPKEWLKKERARIGDWWYRQEYCCEFVDALDQVFSSEDILRAVNPEVKPLWS